jgi:hypothetical protein
VPNYHNLDETIKYLLDPHAHEGYLEAERQCELQDAQLEEAEILEAQLKRGRQNQDCPKAARPESSTHTGGSKV